MCPKYSEYKFEDFLSDDYFIESIKNPTPESIAFWEDQIKLVSEKEYKLAVAFLQTIDIEKQELSDQELSLMFDDLERRLSRNKTKTHQYKKYLLFYAKIACIVIFLFAGFFLLHDRENQAGSEDEISLIASRFKTDLKEDVTTLKTFNDEILISENESFIEYSEEGDLQINKGDKIVSEEGESNTIQYNQLSVPRGKRSTLTLSDGTKLWINASTRVIYPTNFNNEKREIYVDGEVFLEVTKDKDRPFVVNTKDMNIKVLGTSFNVKAYENSATATVVLVEGLVEVGTKTTSKSTQLQPNQKITLSAEGLSVEFVDVEYYTLWRKGAYKFKSEKLSSVLEALSNYYGVEIKCEGRSADHICSGRLNLKDNIEQILSGFDKMLNIAWKYEEGRYVIKDRT